MSLPFLLSARLVGKVDQVVDFASNITDAILAMLVHSLVQGMSRWLLDFAGYGLRTCY